MTHKRVAIYGLVDPRTGEVRYIGKSERPKERLSNHMQERSNCHRSHWLQQLKAAGLRPTLTILEWIEPGADWRSAERRWIAEGRERGWPLTNNTAGGDGVTGLPAEARERIRKTWIGRKHRPESLEKIGNASKGRTHTDAYKQMMRRKMTGRAFSEDTRARISRNVSKLTPDQAAEVKRLLAAGVKQYEIAAMFGVHKSTISNIKRGLFYREAA